MRNPARTDALPARDAGERKSTRKHEVARLARRIAAAIVSDFKADFAAHQTRWFFVALSFSAFVGSELPPFLAWLGGAL